MKTIEIVRYDNRKLYNNKMSRYVNVSELKEFIDAGYNLVVLKHKTKEDVTKQIVGEIIKRCDGDMTKVYLQMLTKAA